MIHTDKFNQPLEEGCVVYHGPKEVKGRVLKSTPKMVTVEFSHITTNVLPVNLIRISEQLEYANTRWPEYQI